MTQRFKDLYQAVHSPIPAAVELLRHVFVSPSTLLAAPLSNPVIERLQWIPPSLDDVNESYLYFNNMINQGASGRIHHLRLEMIHSGPSCWQVCKPEQVEYKVDEKNMEPDALLCEILARVTVWKNEDPNNSLEARDVEPKNKLGIILKLESEEVVEQEDLKGGTKNEKYENIFKNRRLTWKYFDLQDLITPGIDSRPWFKSIEAASKFNTNQSGDEERTITDDQADYWVGYSSSSEETSSIRTGYEGGSVMDPILQARIQNTPLYRSKAPSVSSTNSTDPPHGSGTTHPQGPPNLLSRFSRTRLYKRAPSLVDDDDLSHQTAKNSVLDNLLNAAEIINSPCASYPSSLIPKKMAQIEANVTGDHHHPPEATTSSNDRTLTDCNVSVKELEDHLLDSLRSTFSFYKLSFDLLNRQNHPVDPNDHFSIGERFVALAHRVVLDQTSKLS